MSPQHDLLHLQAPASHSPEGRGFSWMGEGLHSVLLHFLQGFLVCGLCLVPHPTALTPPVTLYLPLVCISSLWEQPISEPVLLVTSTIYDLNLSFWFQITFAPIPNSIWFSRLHFQLCLPPVTWHLGPGTGTWVSRCANRTNPELTVGRSLTWAGSTSLSMTTDVQW